MSKPAYQIPAVLDDANAVQQWLKTWCTEHDRVVAILDPTRYADPEACAIAMGFDAAGFASLPNLHTRFSHGMQTKGPRLFDAPADDVHWPAIHREALRTQAVTFLRVTHGSLLASHLSGLSTLRQPDDTVVLFRYQDTIVLSALLPLLTPPQAAALLGPATGWMVTDVCGHPISITRSSDARPSTQALALDSSQIVALDQALSPGTIIAQANETDTTLLADMTRCQQWRTVQLAQERARGHDLSTPEDIALYCVLSLQLPEGFDEHGPVADALSRHRVTKMGFGKAIDDVPVDAWRAWDKVLDKQRAQRQGNPR